jgi:hypothetical protein
MRGFLCAAILGPALLVSAQTRTPVVVELFTSEGCSSCPPADSLLARLQRLAPDVDIIPLSEHVDYWNHLGWQDRFSAPLFSMRQQDYGRMFHLESVYTPEMVVNGTAEFSGSDEARARREIAKAADGPRAVTSISLNGDSAVHLRVEKTPVASRNVDVFLAITETNLETSVGGGENNGRRLRHVGVVRSLASVGHFDARKAGAYDADAKLTLNSEWNRDNLKLVMFVQDRSNRKIVGAATLKP